MACAYFLAVRDVVNGEDPLGLLAAGAPIDEYDPEVAALMDGDLPMTARRVMDVFEHYFGDAGRLDSVTARRMATHIDRARASRT